MIWTALATIGGAAKRVPWQIWAIAGILLTAWLWGNHRYSQGYDARTAEYEAAAQKAKDRARDADVKAADSRALDTERNDDADDARREAARTGGRDAVNCERLRRAYPDRPLPAGC